MIRTILNFAAAKELDACPVEVIQRFINHSGWFVEAYRSGLTGKAAAWAVKKKQQHHAVSERAVVAMENVNTHLAPLKCAFRTAQNLAVPKNAWEKYEKIIF